MKPPIQVAAELRMALGDLQEHVLGQGQAVTTAAGRDALQRTRATGEAAIGTIAVMVRDFQAEVAKELATGGYWPMATAPTEDGARILGLVQRGHAGGRAVVEPRVLVRKGGRWCSLPGGWTAPVMGWRPVPAEDIVQDAPAYHHQNA